MAPPTKAGHCQNYCNGIFLSSRSFHFLNVSPRLDSTMTTSSDSHMVGRSKNLLSPASRTSTYARKSGYLKEMTNLGDMASDKDEDEDEDDEDEEVKEDEDDEGEEGEGDEDKGPKGDGDSSDTDHI
jgi:hypothetical protein